MKFPIIGRIRLYASVPAVDGTPDAERLREAVTIVPDAGEFVGIEDAWVEMVDDGTVYGTIDVRVRIVVRDGFNQEMAESHVLEAIDIHPNEGEFEDIIEASALGIERRDGSVQELDFETINVDALEDFNVD